MTLLGRQGEPAEDRRSGNPWHGHLARALNFSFRRFSGSRSRRIMAGRRVERCGNLCLFRSGQGTSRCGSPNGILGLFHHKNRRERCGPRLRSCLSDRSPCPSSFLASQGTTPRRCHACRTTPSCWADLCGVLLISLLERFEISRVERGGERQREGKELRFHRDLKHSCFECRIRPGRMVRGHIAAALGDELDGLEVEREFDADIDLLVIVLG